MEAFRKSLAAVQAETANDDGKPAKAAGAEEVEG
jgi:hypothetical protein